MKFDLVFSNNAPNQRNVVWAKLVDGGFALYLLDGGMWKPLKLVDDKGTEDEKDDTVQNLIGSVQDKKSANTINGAKAFAKDATQKIIGTKSDEASDLTLYGLRAYIDKKASSLKKK